ncbi:GNAT family N-acetyltransferase [Tropicimonas isoalkanivorans]|uniref:Acetyltransferase (GNAT) family protein n=1 Tax=Tropicimonas isoalkanivorans TaxID=441112 RepID=A0A1I1ECD8_9RHOB|nr:GNAT family N-acetyltransferase [Tropicimonas isoalkanivorans]SFB82593.1 Acetyltransferase (GNAT) family protein [Tropicimonas isoalkanivorans]
MTSRRTTAPFRSYKPSDRDWIIRANVRHYERIDGFDPSFAEAVSKALDLLEERIDDDTSKFLIAEAGEIRRPVGCVFFSTERAAVGRLRLFYLEEPFRGLGIGRQMIEDLIGHAKTHDFEKILVSTFDRHEAACRLYRKLGFREMAKEPATAFGQLMFQIDFEKTLPDHPQ